MSYNCIVNFLSFYYTTGAFIRDVELLNLLDLLNYWYVDLLLDLKEQKRYVGLIR